LSVSTYLCGQSGAPTPAVAWTDTSYWFVMDQDIDSLGINWIYRDSDFIDARSISFNKNTDSILFFPDLTYPSNDQFAYDANYSWYSGFFTPPYAFDEWFIIRVPSTGNLKITLNQTIGNTIDSQVGASIQWYEFDSSLSEISFVSPTNYPLVQEWKDANSFSISPLQFDLDEDFSLSSNKITKRNILLRIGINDGNPGTFSFINNYYLKIYTNNNLCSNSLDFPDVTAPFISTTDNSIKNLINNDDEISDADYSANKVIGVRGTDDVILPSNSPGIWFKTTTKDTVLYFSACGSQYNPQLLIFTECPTTTYAITGAENDNLFIGDNLTGGTDICLDDPFNTLIPVIKDSTGASSLVPKTIYAYLFGYNGSMGDFNFFITGNNGGGILPVEWLEFGGMPRIAYNELKWSTASESQNDYFILEKSMDGENFAELGRVNGAGNSSFEKHYEFIDQNPYALTYYRISQVDWDGTRSYGETILVKNESNFANYSILENPVSAGNLRIQVNENEIEKVIRIEMFTMQGKSVLQSNYILSKGEGIIELNTYGLPSGAYLLTIADKYAQFNDKVIIQSTK